MPLDKLRALTEEEITQLAPLLGAMPLDIRKLRIGSTVDAPPPFDNPIYSGVVLREQPDALLLQRAKPGEVELPVLAHEATHTLHYTGNIPTAFEWPFRQRRISDYNYPPPAEMRQRGMRIADLTMEQQAALVQRFFEALSEREQPHYSPELHAERQRELQLLAPYVQAIKNAFIEGKAREQKPWLARMLGM